LSVTLTYSVGGLVGSAMGHLLAYSIIRGKEREIQVFKFRIIGNRR
jgi:hypothetical protein